MRRGEVVGLKWSDLDSARSRLSISRSLQNVGGRPIEFGVKTRTSRRTVELDHNTRALLVCWRRRLQRDLLPHGADDWIFCNTSGRFLNPESITQLFDRIVQRSEIARIRFHDLRHTHASLLVADGVAIKGRFRTTRSRPPCVYDAHLSASTAGHERHRRGAVRQPRRRCDPVDVYRLNRRETPGQRLGSREAGRRRR